jgi:hypothetical protein
MWDVLKREDANFDDMAAETAPAFLEDSSDNDDDAGRQGLFTPALQEVVYDLASNFGWGGTKSWPG